MTDFYRLIKDSTTYKIIVEEKRENKLSHAYLFLSSDGQNLKNYLKIFTKLFLCNDTQFCNECRNCNLIDSELHPDVFFYPKEGQEKILTDDVKDIIAETFIKPLESAKKIFVISRFDLLDERTQNKLLKTLEEPPESVCFLLGSVSQSAVLSTIKSRVKTLEIPPFNDELLFDALREDCTDAEKLRQSISAGDGTVSKALAIYNSEQFSFKVWLVKDIIENMQSSKDILEFSAKVLALKESNEIEELINVFELFFADVLRFNERGENAIRVREWTQTIVQAKGFNSGATVYIMEALNEAKRRIKFNANDAMLVEWLLFKILEGKYKWQKL